MKKHIAAAITVISLSMLPIHALNLEPIKYGNMENWVTRNIKESAIIGGNPKVIYEIAPTQVINGNKPYKNMGEAHPGRPPTPTPRCAEW